jgi:hypothetical protein
MSSTAHAGTAFIDPYTGGDITDGGLFATGTISATTAASVTEAPTGPLVINYNSNAANGVYLNGTAPSSTFDFYTSPSLLTLNAAPGTSLIPGTDYTTGGNAALLYLGYDASASNRIDGGAGRAYIALSNTGNILFSLTDGSGTHYSNETLVSPITPSSTELVTSIFLYLDGTQNSSDHFFVDFGETYVNTTTNATGSYDFEQQVSITSPFDAGYGANGMNNLQPALNSIRNGFGPNGYAVADVELKDNTSTSPSFTEQFSSLTQSVPEPTSIAMAAVGAAFLMRRKRQA